MACGCESFHSYACSLVLLGCHCLTHAVIRTQQPADIDYPVFEGVSCVPPSVARPNATCTLGGMPAYVVNVTNGEYPSV